VLSSVTHKEGEQQFSIVPICTADLLQQEFPWLSQNYMAVLVAEVLHLKSFGPHKNHAAEKANDFLCPSTPEQF